jgi:hypothetical protein
MCVFNCCVTWYEKCNICGLHAAVGLKRLFPCMCLTCSTVVAGTDSKASNMAWLFQNEIYEICISVLQFGRILHVLTSFGLGGWKPRKYINVFTRPHALPSSWTGLLLASCSVIQALYSLLSHCATSRKVAGSIPDGVIGLLHWHNPSGRTMALGLTQPLTEMR